MALTVQKYGSDLRRGEPCKHPAEWGRAGTGDKYTVVENKVLQKTDIGSNNNKFYSLEKHKNGSSWRLFSHYGRTGGGGTGGTKECRYGSQRDVEREFAKILASKSKKGYVEINLAKSSIGSEKAQGKSSGFIDDKTIKAMKSGTKSRKKKAAKSIDTNVRKLVEAIYTNAGTALTSKANVKITADGFETPLGVLTMGQVESGFDILNKIRKEIQSSNKTGYTNYSGDFYSTIPHKLGRTKDKLAAAVLDTIKKTDDTEETLQLMKDMLEVNKATGVNLFASDEITDRFAALKTDISYLSPSDSKWTEIVKYVETSQARGHSGVKVSAIYEIARQGEHKGFNPKKLSGVKELFHGTGAQNVVGILTRGLLLPKMAQRHGARISGAMFGPGLYFADASTKSANYCGYNVGNKQYMFLAGVALGKIKKYTKATYVTVPPGGYDSVMGTKSVSRAQYNYLVNNEYIIYNSNQQEIRYIIEFTRK